MSTTKSDKHSYINTIRGDVNKMFYHYCDITGATVSPQTVGLAAQRLDISKLVNWLDRYYVVTLVYDKNNNFIKVY